MGRSIGTTVSFVNGDTVIAGIGVAVNNGYMSIRARIREAREHLGLSKSELARRCGVTPSSAIDWEREGGTSPSVENMAKIAVELGVAFEWLATGRGQRQVVAPAGDAVGEAVPAYAVPAVEVSPQARAEQSMIEAFRRLPDEAREAVLGLLSAWPRRGKQDPG